MTREAGRTTYHSFSYGAHYDPDNVAFGPLIALNEEVLPAGTGYDAHRHVNTEIVTWVLDGALHHADSLGTDGVLPAGTVQVTSTGSGISHIERAGGLDTRFLQMMLRPDEYDAQPAAAVTPLPATVGLHDVPVSVTGARLRLGSLLPGSLTLPEAPLLLVFLVSGHALLGDRELSTGDSARLQGQPGRKLVVEEPSALCVWAFGVAEDDTEDVRGSAHPG